MEEKIKDLRKIIATSKDVWEVAEAKILLQYLLQQKVAKKK